MTTFKAVDGHITDNGAKHLANPDAVAIVGENALTEHHQPCTIIPGHWAERIESGELLTVGEYNALKKEYRTAVIESSGELTTKWDVYLIQHIARKLRGGA